MKGVPSARRNQEGPLECARQRFRVGLATGALLVLVWSVCLAPSEATSSARVLPSGEGIELAGEGPEGSYREVIPIYRSGDIRYFSTGVGLEEREAEYPAFPLKIILVAGEKAYLSHVAVMIRDQAGTVQLDIPEGHVNGPWIFVDLPDGTYDVAGVSGRETQERKNVAVRSGSVRTVYLRWP